MKRAKVHLKQGTIRKLIFKNIKMIKRLNKQKLKKMKIS